MTKVEEGGPVLPGEPFIVGDRGPELFVPSEDGFVLPLQVCVACGFHRGYHSENCDLETWSEAEKRAADGDR